MKTLVIVLALIANTVFGATRTWTGAIGNRWSSPANWDGGVPASGDDVVCSTMQPTINDLPGGVHLNSLVIAAGTQISGNDIVLGAGGFSTIGPRLLNKETKVASKITLEAPQTWTNPSSVFFVEFALIDLNGQTLTVNSPDTLFMELISGAGTLVQSGKGLTILMAAGDARSRVTVNDGILHIRTGRVEAAQVHGGMLVLLDRVALGSITVDGSGALFVGTRSFSSSLTFVESTDSLGTLDVPVRDIPNDGLYAGSAGTIEVPGTISLGNALLKLEFIDGLIPGYPSVTFIDNPGAAPISGTFLGLPEGSVINYPHFQSFRLSYVGGDGNDATLTPVGFYNESSVAVTSPANPSNPGRVTVTARVTPKTAQGSVGFYHGSVFLGSTPLDASGQASISVDLPNGKHTITAAYSGSSAFASSRGTLQQLVFPQRTRAVR